MEYTHSTPNETDYELIQRFFDFELSEAELKQVESRMENDVAFRERLFIYQSMEAHIESEIGTKKEARVVELPTVQSVWGNWRRLAAMLVLAIGCLFVFYLYSNQIKSDTVLAQQYWAEREDLSSQLRSENSEDEALYSTLNQAITYKERGETAQAMEILNTIATSDDTFLEATFLKAEILFEQQDYETAINQYQTIIKHPSKAYQDTAYWYQALAYVEAEQWDKAKANLNYIIAQAYPIADKAQKLLAQL